jgi:hypothetical protein
MVLRKRVSRLHNTSRNFEISQCENVSMKTAGAEKRLSANRPSGKRDNHVKALADGMRVLKSLVGQFEASGWARQGVRAFIDDVVGERVLVTVEGRQLEVPKSLFRGGVDAHECFVISQGRDGLRAQLDAKRTLQSTARMNKLFGLLFAPA